MYDRLEERKKTAPCVYVCGGLGLREKVPNRAKPPASPAYPFGDFPGFGRFHLVIYLEAKIAAGRSGKSQMQEYS